MRLNPKARRRNNAIVRIAREVRWQIIWRIRYNRPIDSTRPIIDPITAYRVIKRLARGISGKPPAPSLALHPQYAAPSTPSQ